LKQNFIESLLNTEIRILKLIIVKINFFKIRAELLLLFLWRYIWKSEQDLNGSYFIA